MKHLNAFITESKCECDDAIDAFIGIMMQRCRTGELKRDDAKQRLLQFLMDDDDEFLNFIDPSSRFGIRYSTRGSNALKKFMKKYPHFDKDAERFNLNDEQYHEYVEMCKPIYFREMFSEIDVDLKTRDDKLMVERVIKIESNVDALRDQMDFYNNGIGIYWSFYRGGAYSSLDEVQSEPIYVRIRALANNDCVAQYDTKRALLNAGEEAEITMKSDAFIELYEMEFTYNDKCVRKHRFKPHILCKI